MGAGTLVGISAGHIMGKEASSRITDTHGTMYEYFYFYAGLFFDGSNFIQIQFPGQYDPLGPQFLIKSCCLIIGDIGLGTDYHRDPGSMSFNQTQNTQV